MIKSHVLVQEYRKQFGKTYKEMDCIHSIANIIYRYGGKSDLTGSNWWARYEAKNMRPLTSRAQLYDGCGVLKSKLPGEPGYNLPDTYKDHPVKIDFNHIGIGTDQGEILDSTTTKDSQGGYVRNGPGVSTAPIGPNSWDIIFDIEDVDYSDRGGQVTMPDEERSAVIVAESGSTVNMRSRASLNAVVLEYVKIGTRVQLGDTSGDWTQITLPNNKVGWVKSEFLAEAEDVITPPVQDASLQVLAQYGKVLAELEALGKLLQQ